MYIHSRYIMSTETTVAKWGNSLAIRIPRGIAKQAGLDEGDCLALSCDDSGDIVLRAARPRYCLEDLVSGITKKNRHGETKWGSPKGKEIW